MARAQFHKKQSWRQTSPNPEREKAINWRLDKEVSLGLLGEIGVHAIDQACWLLNVKPAAASGFGSVAFWKDGREVPDTVQALLEFPGGMNMMYHASLANSFDADYELLYGSEGAVMMRDGKAWMFKEVDSRLFGWEVYARKETFYKETGIALMLDASKSSGADQPPAPEPFTKTPLAYSLGNGRVAILHWDVHRGNGTQHIFEDDPDVLYCSLHQYPFYPGTGAREERGRGKGLGATLNIPLPAGTGEAAYLRAFDDEVLPALERFRPDLLIVSAGFDAHRDDPLGGMKLTEASFGGFTRRIRDVAPVVSVLEGGYHLDALARSVEVHLLALARREAGEEAAS